jgi:phospholipid/cholesterol/gamma-HCH transport system ATP-binding protein
VISAERPPQAGASQGAAAPLAAELRGVYVRLGAALVLRGVDLPVPRGEITALVALSGAGKTTLMRTMCGLLTPAAGEVLLDGKPLARLSVAARARARRRISVSFQNGALFGSMTVYDNVAFAMRRLREHDEGEIQERVRAILRDVELERSCELTPDQLSAGMRRRVALARALVRDADLYLLDDIDSGLDLGLLDRIAARLRERRERGEGTYLVSTHDMEVVRAIADSTAVLSEGRIVALGAACELERAGPEAVRQLLRGAVAGPVGLRSDPALATGDPEELYTRRYGLRWEQFLRLPVAMLVLAIAMVIYFVLHGGITG